MSSESAADAKGEAADASSARPLWRRIIGSGWFHLVAAFVVTGLLLAFVAKPYVVPSGSMEQTLQVGDRVLVNRLAYTVTPPEAGDVVVFDADAAWDSTPRAEEPPLKAFARWLGEISGFGPSGRHTLVKRIIATPGQTVSCCSSDGAVVVDGQPLDESYVFEDLLFTPGTSDCTTEPRSSRCFDEVVVPDDRYLMLGDHRSRSADSAVLCRPTGAPESCWRWASRDEIVGEVAVILWPIPRWSVVH